jgi:HSP20 family protein
MPYAKNGHARQIHSEGRPVVSVQPDNGRCRLGRTHATPPPDHLQTAEAMNQLTKWDPFHELENMHRRLTTLFDGDTDGDTSRRRNGNSRESMTVAEWAPVVDITEDDKAYVIKAELPEVKKEDVHVTVENGVLTLTGERKVEKEEKGRKYHRIERSYGTFARSFALPDDIDANKVNASYKDGMLTITVAKSEHAKPRQIEVKIS